MPQDLESLKEQAARKAVEHVQSGIRVGLGSGSTATHFTRALAHRIQSGALTEIVCVPTSIQVGAVAHGLELPLSSLEEHPVLDITVDGADEVDPGLNLIKGGGGALLHEKIVAQASIRTVIIVDETKLVLQLGTHWSVPVEVIRFGWRTHLAYLSHLGADVKLRQTADGSPFVTDEGNCILDCNFGLIHDPQILDRGIRSRAGIVETGLFINIASEVIVASDHGIRSLQQRRA